MKAALLVFQFDSRGQFGKMIFFIKPGTGRLSI